MSVLLRLELAQYQFTRVDMFTGSTQDADSSPVVRGHQLYAFAPMPMGPPEQ
jgi:hypothetical protein